MVGSDRGKEAMAMMALHEALRNVCINSDWTYSVFWTIRPRPRSRGGTGCKVGDENGSLMLMWEDGYCRPSKPTNPRLNRLPPGPFNNSAMAKSPSFDCLEEMDADDPVRKAFRKMSIQLYNYGEGLMGKVASDKCHKWVFKEPNECEAGISNYWQSSFDAHPPEWTDQFASGIQTIVVIQAGHGLLQLGSCKIIPEDLHFVLRMRHAFDSLGYQSGFYLSQLFSAQAAAGNNSNRPNNGGACNTTSPPPALPQPKPAMSPRPPIYNWNPRPPLQGGGPLGMGLGSPHVHQLRPQHHQQQHQQQQETSTSHLLLPVSQQTATAAAGAGVVVVQPQDSRSVVVSDSLVLSASEMLCNTNNTPNNHNNNSSSSNNNNNNNGSNSSNNNQQDSADIKWPNGLSYLSALTARADDKHLFFGPEYPDACTTSAVATLPHQQQQQQQQQSEQQHQQLSMHGIPVPPSKHSSPASSSEFTSVDHHHNLLLHHHHQAGGNSNSNSSIPTRRMHAVSRLDKFKRSLTLPARMSPATPSPATSPHVSTHSQSHELVDPHQHQHHHHSNHESSMDFSMTPSATQGPPNMYSDLMEGFLE